MQNSIAPAELSPKKLLAFFGMVVGMFMAILDIQIVASSLPIIGAGLSASGDELSWIQTSYLIAEVIIIPITGYTARLLSTRISYFIAAFGFTIMSVLCSLAQNIESMILFRSLQGFFGGAMIPTVFGIIYVIFPKNMHVKVSTIIGLVVTVAPTVGPTLGGYITEISSWHFMFLINVIPGIFVCMSVFLYGDFDKPNYKLLQNFDTIGIILMITSLGSLQYILEEGNKKDWFDDTTIILLTLLVVIGLISFTIREIKFENPIVDLTAFKNKNFSFGCIYSFILGAGLYGSVYLMPLFLYTIADFNTYEIGLTMVVTGLFQFISAPLAGTLVSVGIDKRLVLAIGFGGFGYGCYLNSFLTADSRYWELFIPQMVRGLSLMFCFIPINSVTFGTIPLNQVQNASGLYNLTRNLGGAIGLAVINNLITSKSQAYSQGLKENISSNSSEALNQLDSLTQLLSSSNQIIDPRSGALMLIDNLINREAFIMAINNIFGILSLLFFTSVFLLFFTASPETETISNDAH